MIRVNLLAPERPSQKRRAAPSVSAPSTPGAFQMYVFLLLFGGGALGFCGFWWFMEQAKIKDLDKKIAVAMKRQQELQEIKKQVEALELKRRTLEQKRDLIERLKKEQQYPVHLLDEISKALPNFVWLTTMSQSASGVVLDGRSNGLTAVADFMTNLQNSGWFPTVDLGTTKEGTDGVITFKLTATFRDPTMPAPTPMPTPPPRGPARR
jgi:type IV pilus assembly protein PilN